MFYEAVKAAFKLFPMDPPGILRPGDYVRIGWGGRIRHYGSLGQLLRIEVETDETSHPLEFLSEGVRKGGVSGSSVGIAEAKIAFSDRPSLYIRGKRTVRKVRNLQSVLLKLDKSKRNVNWSPWYRIVVETHEVEHADIVCSGNSAADLKVSYDDRGLPISLDGDYVRQQSGLLHFPDVSGTFAFAPIWFIFGQSFGASGASSGRYKFGALDVNNPKDFEGQLDDEQ